VTLVLDDRHAEQETATVTKCRVEICQCDASGNYRSIAGPAITASARHSSAACRRRTPRSPFRKT